MQRFEDVLQCALYAPGLVRIFNAHNERAAGMACVQPVEKGGADIAHVWVAGGAGGIADTDRVVIHSTRIACCIIDMAWFVL